MPNTVTNSREQNSPRDNQVRTEGFLSGSAMEICLEVLFAISFLLFFQPQSYAIGESFSDYWGYALTMVSLLGIVLCLLCNGIEMKWAAFVVFYVFIYFVTSTYSNSDTATVSNIRNLIKGIGFVSLLLVGFAWDKKRCLRAFIFGGLIMCGFHLVSFWEYRDVVGGIKVDEYVQYGTATKITTQNWYLLTYDNYSIVYSLPVAVSLWYYTMVYSKRYVYISVVFSAAFLFSYIYKSAVTAEIVFALLFILAALLYSDKKPVKKLLATLTYKRACIIGISFSVVLIALVGGDVITTVAGWFGKSGTLSGRESIWAKALEIINENPFGIGIVTNQTCFNLIGQTHCHNIVLQLLFNGGVIALALFAWILVTCRPSKQDNSIGTALLVFAIFLLFVFAGIDWLLSYPTFWFVFVMLSVFSDEQSTLQKETSALMGS